MHLVSSANVSTIEEETQLVRSLIKMINRRGPKMLPWGTPEVTGRTEER